jgi:riboflavin transporter FmnP
MKRNFDVKKITRIAILAALSTVLFYIGDIPIIPAFPHLKISLADIPAAVAAVAMGPVAGIIVELIKNLLHVLLQVLLV